MKLKFYFLASVFTLISLLNANAQLNCNYRLEMFDSFGDGWNGASLDVNTGGTITNFTVGFDDNNGQFNIVEFEVTEGESLTLTYFSGTFDNEVTYSLFDSDNLEIFTNGPNPTVGLAFEGTSSCPTCPALNEESIVYTTTPGGAEVSWTEGQVAGSTYIIEYGPVGFEQGTGTSTTSPTNSFSLTGQAENSFFDFYIQADCGGGEISSIVGPVFVQSGSAGVALECNYTLELIAGGGFGWGNSSIDVTLNGITTNYTVLFGDNNGDFLNVDIPITSPDYLVLSYNDDGFNDDNSYNLLDPEGFVVFASGPDPIIGESFNSAISCPTCPAIDAESFTVTQSPGGFDLTWEEGQLPGGYILEYGPLGFEPGAGTTEILGTNSFSLSDQEEGTLFDVYISLDCGNNDASSQIGPLLAQAGYLNPPSECAYTLEMFDSFGDGWNGASIDITINGTTTNYTVLNTDNNGDFNIVDVAVEDGSLITIGYSGGSFENEVTYNLIDSDGFVVFTDGPFPVQSDNVFQGVASCPPCPLPIQSSFEVESGSTDATINWSEIAPAVSYTVEYGPGCFELGEGETLVITDVNSADLTGLLPSTVYSYYLMGDCGAEGLSNTAGPFFFETAPACYPPAVPSVLQVDITTAAITWVPTPNTAEYIVQYGPVGFALGGGTVTDPIAGNITTIEDLAPNTSYEFYVYGTCGGVPSEYLGPLTFTTLLPCEPATNLFLDAVNDVSATVSWIENADAESYIVEFGPTGFELGSGQIQNTLASPITLNGLNSGVTYDVYVTSFCNTDGTSITVGPLAFETEYIPSGTGGTNGSVCTYTLAMFDTFGDGWNGASVNVVNGDLDEIFTVNFADNNGDFNIVEFDVTSGEDLILNYTPGAFENEVNYTLFDSEGNIIFQDGPFAAVGEVFNMVALCPLCSGITDGEISTIRAQDATATWEMTSAQQYLIEYGAVGFTLGTGTVLTTIDTTLTITGLTPNTWYNVFITPDCGPEDGLGRPLGPLAFKTSLLNDVGISGFASPTDLSCVLGLEDVSVFIQNFGQNPQQLIPFFYSLNFESASINNPVDGLYTGVVGKDSMEVIDFDQQLDFSVPGYYYFEAWTELEGDENPSNDTFSFELVTSTPLPFFEDFNDSNQLPEGWTTTLAFGNPIMEPGVGFDLHGLTSNAIGEELFNFTPEFQFTTHRIGVLEATSTLTFDYRFVTEGGNDTANPFTLGADDILEISVSTDCGETYEVVGSIVGPGDFATTFFKQASFSLGDYAGEAVNIRFNMNNGGTGNFFIDIDNIGIAGCPSSMFIQGDISPSESFTVTNGSIFAMPTFGMPPFTFNWSNGETTAFIDGLAPTTQTVTITDANGCSDQRTFDLSTSGTENPVTPAFEALTLAPNPTTGLTQLQVSLLETSDILVQVYDLSGRLIQQARQNNQLETTFDLDLKDETSGMYFVRIQAANDTQVLKLNVSK